MRKTRLKRTDQLLRESLAELILTRVSDPRIGFVSVTGVEISPELDTARVFVTVLGDAAARASALEGLKSAAPYLQSELNKRVRLRRMPRLRFVYDTSLDRGFRVEAALREAGPLSRGGEERSAPDEIAQKEGPGDNGVNDIAEEGGDEERS